MSLKKIIISGTIVTTLTGVILPVTTYAKGVNTNLNVKSNQQISYKNQFNKKELDKLDRFVELDTTNKQFKLLSSAKTNLTKSELNYVNNAISKSNNIISRIFKDSTVSTEVVNNTLKVEPKDNNISTSSNTSNLFTTMSINKKAYWDYEMHWWGPSIFLSSSFVNKLKSYSTTITGPAAAGAGVALRQALIFSGMGATAAGWIGAAAGLEAAIYFDQITSRCSRTGVFVDANWVGGCNIYSA
ncbi:hypothetical protein [Clostridium tyrobutyricum]|jgi:hypothetical protein|uniref:hypothetical protein n=1 Tax=Clostridium tyrobutyricum TaxID=1519 RepID=UPI0010A9E660|nr:hypothetical protein [Clostridium tyrobutyricum]MBR9647945.1 hypothetical protein [Clostridium tyrobutyricum]QCH27024.1 hypothetical protein EZN00_00613 [Clostridium tyrobutyricum]